MKVEISETIEFENIRLADVDLKVDLITLMREARHEREISQKKLEEISGVKQSVIAKLELGVTDPQLSTVLRILLPLGKTLKIVDACDRESA